MRNWKARGARTRERSRRREQGSPFLCLFLGSNEFFTCRYFLFPSFLFSGKARRGAGGSCRGPPADCERSWRTANATGLYMYT